MIHPITHLLIEDQKNIKLFRENKITKEDLIKLNKQTSEEFKAYIQKNNFPLKSESEEIYKAAIILALHSGLESLKSIYEKIKDLDEQDIEPKHKAHLIDKILVLECKPQLYGTQFTESSNGSKELFPIQDPEHLEERRREVGLD